MKGLLSLMGNLRFGSERLDGEMFGFLLPLQLLNFDSFANFINLILILLPIQEECLKLPRTTMFLENLPL